MTKDKYINAKCECCGKFVKRYSDDTILVFTPDSEFTIESFEYYHKKCKK
jgi:hypothetical protein